MIHCPWQKQTLNTFIQSVETSQGAWQKLEQSMGLAHNVTIYSSSLLLSAVKECKREFPNYITNPAV